MMMSPDDRDEMDGEELVYCIGYYMIMLLCILIEYSKTLKTSFSIVLLCVWLFCDILLFKCHQMQIPY